MSAIVFVHGAWLDARCWQPVRELLKGEAVSAVALDLPGHGQDATPLGEISLKAYVDQVVGLAEAQGSRVTLVGHSMAGIVLSQAAEERPDLFRKLIYVAAYLPAPGQSLNDLAQTDAHSGVGPAMRPALDWSTLDIAEEARADLFFHDVPSGIAAPYLLSWKAEPVAPMATPLQLTPERFGKVARLYVRTSADRVVSPDLQARMLQTTPTEAVTMDCGHLAMLASSQKLASLIKGDLA